MNNHQSTHYQAIHKQTMHNKAMHTKAIHPKIIIAKEPHHYEHLHHTQCIPCQMLGT